MDATEEQSAAGDVRLAKVARLKAAENPPRVVDLFCGAGGFSLGFERAGCEILGGIEVDPDAIRTHAQNFHGHLEQTQPSLFEAHATPRDIRETDPLDWLHELGHADPVRDVDILIGGPPCPAYTRVGRAKLREIHDHPEAFKHDDRATLYVPYLRWVETLKPLALVMENVPDILNFAGHNLAEEFCDVLEGLGYACSYSLLNAASYDVPQMRPRFILMGVHETARGAPLFPVAARRVELPPGYEQAELSALRPLRAQEGALEASRYIEAPAAHPDAPPAVGAGAALGDLPRLTTHLVTRLPKGRSRPDSTSDRPYDAKTVQPSDWVREHMLGWPGRDLDPTRDPLNAHVIRSLTWRDFRLFRRMAEGDQYFEAYRLALDCFEDRRAAIEAQGGVFVEETAPGREAFDVLDRMLGEVAGLLDAPGRRSSAVAKLRSSLLQLTGAFDQTSAAFQALVVAATGVGIEGEDPALLLWPDLADATRSIGLLVDALGTPPEPKLLAGEAATATRRFNAVRRAERRSESWKAGLRSLANTDQYSREPRSGPALLKSLGSGRELKTSLLALAESLADVRSPPMVWVDPAKRRPIVVALWLRLAELSWSLCTHHTLRARFVPPYVPDKFPNKWRKMEKEAPVRTLMAHLGKDSYSHIHYDSEQARTLSIREAARLQSFPDSFRFSGSMNPAFRQIGNAVPPLFSWHLARAVLDALPSGHIDSVDGDGRTNEHTSGAADGI